MKIEKIQLYKKNDDFLVKLGSTIGGIFGLGASIILGVFLIIFKILLRFRNFEYKFALYFLVLYGLTSFFQQIVNAPRANASQPYTGISIPSLNPNITEREQNINLIKQIWGNDAQIGLNIALCESGYRTKAEHVNSDGSIDQGIFQINSTHELPDMENAVANVLEGYRLYVEQGTTPWNSSKACWINL